MGEERSRGLGCLGAHHWRVVGGGKGGNEASHPLLPIFRREEEGREKKGSGLTLSDWEEGGRRKAASASKAAREGARKKKILPLAAGWAGVGEAWLGCIGRGKGD